MTPARLRELAASVDPRDRLAVLIEADAVSREPVTTEIVSDALMWAAGEIERLRILALEGWTEARESAKDSGDGSGVERASIALTEIEAAS